MIYLIRLPLVLAKNVTFNQFAKWVINHKRFFDYQKGTVTIIELHTGKYESANSKLSYLFINAIDSNTTLQDGVENWRAKSKSQ